MRQKNPQTKYVIESKPMFLILKPNLSYDMSTLSKS